MEHAGRTRAELPPWLSYACAAVAAVVLDYPVDVAVKRSMAAPPEEPVAGPLLATARLLRTHRWGGGFGPMPSSLLHTLRQFPWRRESSVNPGL